jgi:hypothetical protein
VAAPLPPTASPYVIAYHGRFEFDVAPTEMWLAIERCDQFEAWWGWLREFRLEGARLEDGAVLRGVVSPPVPYEMRIEVVLDRCLPPRRVDATVRGDLIGGASLELGLLRTAAGACTVAEVRWVVEMTQRPMRIAARFAHPLLRWGHDRVVDATVAGFRRHLAGAPDSAAPT